MKAAEEEVDVEMVSVSAEDVVAAGTDAAAAAVAVVRTIVVMEAATAAVTGKRKAMVEWKEYVAALPWENGNQSYLRLFVCRQ